MNAPVVMCMCGHAGEFHVRVGSDPRLICGDSMKCPCMNYEPDGDAALSAMAPTELEGASDPGDPRAFPMNAAEFAARWNRLPEDERDKLVRAIVLDAERASLCRVMHGGSWADPPRHLTT